MQQAPQSKSETARNALSLMNELGLEPSPINYKVWFAYVEEIDLELCRAVDACLTQDDGINDEDIGKIHYQFFSIEAELQQAREVSSQLQNTMMDVHRRLEAKISEQRTLGTQMEVHGEQLSSPVDQATLQKIAQQLLDDTAQIIDCNSALEEQLGSSLQQIHDLRSDLSLVEKEAMTDALTGLYNRRHFNAQVETLTSFADADGKALSLLMVDVDHFKAFNDDYGHQMGDHALKYVSNCVRQCVRGRDVPTRYGGEEIAILLPDTPLENAKTVCNNIRAALAERGLKNKRTGESLRPLTVSIGIAEHRAGQPSDTMIAEADKALYAAKEQGRDRFVVADDA